MNSCIRRYILGNNLINLSRTGPGAFEFKRGSSVKKDRPSLHFNASTHLVGGVMFGVLVTSSVIDKINSNGYVKSYLTMIPVETEWERTVSVISEVADKSGLKFPTSGDGIVIGTINSRADRQPRVPILGASPAKRARGAEASAGWRESCFAGDTYPVYRDIPAGFDWCDMEQLRRMKTEPLPGSRVCVAYTSSLYQDSNKGDTEPIRVSFNLQWLAVLGEANE